MNRKEFFKRLLTAAVGLRALMFSSLTLATLSLEGCVKFADLAGWIDTGIQAFAGIVMIINPPAGSVLLIAVQTAEGLWKALQAAVADYNNPSLPKSTTFQKVIAALIAVQDGLQGVIDSLPITIPSMILLGIKAGLALLIATLNHFAVNIPPPQDTSNVPLRTARMSTNSKTQVTAASVKPATNRDDFVKKFNALNLKTEAGVPVTVK